MEKFIPYKKMSKKKQKEINQKKRASWNGLNPVTRKSENRKAYNRKKVLKWNDDSFQDLFVFPLSAKKRRRFFSAAFLKPARTTAFLMFLDAQFRLDPRNQISTRRLLTDFCRVFPRLLTRFSGMLYPTFR